ncbi:hypothetical protein TNCV_3660491 [Trichonephila clavipes]|nr:hypothetical protein TNCV_3660491 [Trichonephila clavipes]
MPDHLEDNIRRVIADIRSQMLEKVIENWTSRLDYIRASRGSHMPEIIFKMVQQCLLTFPYCTVKGSHNNGHHSALDIVVLSMRLDLRVLSNPTS